VTGAACCPLGGGDDAPPTTFGSCVVKAAKDHRCTECRETIPKGSKYERVKGLWDGSWSTFKTCLSCVEIRDHFACENGWLFGEVWSQIEENFFPDMKAGGPCMAGLSPGAKDRLFTLRMKWLEDWQ
jgi:hypothetical protein